MSKDCKSCAHNAVNGGELPCRVCIHVWGAVSTDEVEYLDLWQPAATTPMTTQVDGSHYTKLKIQPLEYSMANGLDACQHSIVKYVTRFRDKNGLRDLYKARDVLDKLIYFYEQELADGKSKE